MMDPQAIKKACDGCQPCVGCGQHIPKARRPALCDRCAAPTADVTREPTGGQELRDVVAEWMREHLSWGLDPSKAPDAADAVLALPELAALIADADNWRRATTGDPTEPEPLAMQARELLLRVRELEATVARVRVRELHDRLITIAHDSESLTAVIYRQNADRLRRALDGDQ